MFLVADDAMLAVQPASRFGLAWLGLMAIGVITGVLLSAVWGVAWQVFGDYGLLVMPALMSCILWLAWPMRKGVAGLARIAGGKDPTWQTTISALLGAVAVICFVCLKPDWYRAEFVLPESVRWLRMDAKMYRVLVLMPVWGSWAMLALPQFCKPCDITGEAVRGLARGCGPLCTAVCMALLFLWNLAYFHYLGTGAELIIPIVTACSSVIFGIIMARRSGGLTRSVLLADSFLTQLVFLLTYLAFQP